MGHHCTWPPGTVVTVSEKITFCLISQPELGSNGALEILEFVLLLSVPSPDLDWEILKNRESRSTKMTSPFQSCRLSRYSWEKPPNQVLHSIWGKHLPWNMHNSHKSHWSLRTFKTLPEVCPQVKSILIAVLWGKPATAKQNKNGWSKQNLTWYWYLMNILNILALGYFDNGHIMLRKTDVNIQGVELVGFYGFLSYWMVRIWLCLD